MSAFIQGVRIRLTMVRIFFVYNPAFDELIRNRVYALPHQTFNLKMSLLFAFVLVVCTASTLGAPVEERATAINFAESCPDISLGSSDVLTAACFNNAGALVTSSISLDSCIANTNGKLVAKSGGAFDHSCTDVVFESSGSSAELTAQCNNDKKQAVTTTIDLNSVLTNNNGFLTCP
ncbi:Cyanovirin-N [Schizopora paradoxa]|uniref:Cyanovirin-N n=1 Tax=Schizopora paradoxa TaxID=27342 RepID=A0A0H2R927_9AGAM|nr:Cyanovirin-N [Schizopora paradoxa]